MPGDVIDNKLNKELVAALMPPEELRTSYDQLKPFERQFVDAYIATDSPIGAVRQIFPGEGLTEEQRRTTHRVRAYDLIRRPLVQAAIAERLMKIAGKFELTAERVLAEVAKIAYSNMDDYFVKGEDGVRKLNLDDATRDQMAAVGKIKVKRTTDKETGDVTEEIEFALHDKLGALEKAMKNLGLYAPEKHIVAGMIQNVDGPNGSPRQLITIDMSEDEAAQRYSDFLAGN